MSSQDLTGHTMRLRTDAPYRELVGDAKGVVRGVKPTIAPYEPDERGPVYLVRFTGLSDTFPHTDTANYADELEVVR